MRELGKNCLYGGGGGDTILAQARRENVDRLFKEITVIKKCFVTLEAYLFQAVNAVL